jgi:cysteinyl-tRNA synthetase
MAKSVGNIDKVRDLLDEFPGEALRLMLLKTHYRSPLEFTKDGLREAKAQLDRWYRLKQLADEYCAESGWPRHGWEPIGEDEDPLVDALSDDFNTAEAITVLSATANQAFHSRDQDDSPRVVAQFAMDLEREAAVLGLLQGEAKDWFRWQPTSAAAIDEGKIAELIDLRLAARKSKNFKEADRIRDELAKQGVLLEDGPKGTTWRRAG